MTDSRSVFNLGEKGLNKVLERRVFAAGDFIFQKGQAARDLFVVLRGEVEIVSRDAAGKDVLLTTVKTGQTFGELAFFTGSARTAAALTRKGCELMVLNHEVLRKKFDAADPVLRFLITYLADRVVDLTNRLSTARD